MGRPCLYTTDKLDEITTRLSKGEPLEVICRDDYMPSSGTVRDWMKREDIGELVTAAIARAREVGFDALAADCLIIADDSGGDYHAGKSGQEFDSEHVQRAKLRIETRLKLLAKWDPKRYGERVAHELSGPGGGPVAMVGGSMTAEQAAEAYAATLRGNGG